MATEGVMDRLLQRSLLIGGIVLGGGAAVLLAVGRPAAESKAEAASVSAAAVATSESPIFEDAEQPAPTAKRPGSAPRLAAAAKVEPLWDEYAPETAQQADEASGAGAPQSGISTDALLKVLEKFSEVAKTQASAGKADPRPVRGPALADAAPSADGDPAPEDVEVVKPEDVLKMAAEGEDLPPPGRASAKKALDDGEASITHTPGYSEGDEHLEIHIQDEDLRKVLALLSEQGGLNILAGPSVQGTTVSASLKDVSVDAALDAILRSTGYVAQRSGKFIYVGTPQDFEMMKQSADRIAVRVYRPNYVTSKDLSALLTPLLSAAPVGKISLSAPAEVGIAPQGNTAGGDSLSESEAVVVQDYEAVLKEIDQVVKEIDQRPPQVCIQAMILSVQLNDANQMGIDFQMLRNQQNLRFGLGSPRTAPLNGSGQMDQNGNTIGAFNFANGGMNLAFLDGSLGAFFAFLETIGDTNVIATPKVMCLNKQRAEIQIGEQLGYVTTTLTSTSTAQTINFLDTGAQLRLRPFISSDGLIRLEVHPELSTGTVEQKAAYTLPNKQVTQVTTNIMVRDGCTVVIGGLMREDLQTDITQIPFMGSLPWIGPLFRHKTEKMTRSGDPRAAHAPFDRGAGKRYRSVARRRRIHSPAERHPRPYESSCPTFSGPQSNAQAREPRWLQETSPRPCEWPKRPCSTIRKTSKPSPCENSFVPAIRRPPAPGPARAGRVRKPLSTAKRFRRGCWKDWAKDRRCRRLRLEILGQPGRVLDIELPSMFDQPKK